MKSSSGVAGRMQRLVTGFRCEKRGCFEQAEWFVSFESQAHHWCARHTIARMEDAGTWKIKVIPEVVGA